MIGRYTLDVYGLFYMYSKKFSYNDWTYLWFHLVYPVRIPLMYLGLSIRLGVWSSKVFLSGPGSWDSKLKILVDPIPSHTLFWITDGSYRQNVLFWRLSVSMLPDIKVPFLFDLFLDKESPSVGPLKGRSLSHDKSPFYSSGRSVLKHQI